MQESKLELEEAIRIICSANIRINGPKVILEVISLLTVLTELDYDMIIIDNLVCCSIGFYEKPYTGL